MRGTIVFATVVGALLTQGSSVPEPVVGGQGTAPVGRSADLAKPFRVDTYRVPASAGDLEGAECVVFFFNAGHGGSLEANLDRWAGQFEPPKRQRSTRKMRQEVSGGFNVTTVDISGTYVPSTPRADGGAGKANYRMIGAAVEGRRASALLKLIGPLKTVEAVREEFKTLTTFFGSSLLQTLLRKDFKEALSRQPARSGSFGGVEWIAPARWSKYRGWPIRFAPYAYTVPPAPGDTRAGELRVGSPAKVAPQEILRGWSHLFPSHARFECLLRYIANCGPERKPEMPRRNIGGFNVTTVDVSGAYMPSGSPVMRASAREPSIELEPDSPMAAKPNYRMRAAIVEGHSGGEVFFQLIGPEKTVAAAKAEFEAMLKSIRKSDHRLN